MSYENQLLRNKMMNIDSRKFSAFSDQLDSFRTSHAYSKIQNRIKQANQINHENLGIQKRLVGTTSMYSVKQFELDNQKRKYIASNISKNARRVGYLPEPIPIMNTPNQSLRAKSAKLRSNQTSIMQSPTQGQLQLSEIRYDYGILENSLASRNQKLSDSRYFFPQTATAATVTRKSIRLPTHQNSVNVNS